MCRVFGASLGNQEEVLSLNEMARILFPALVKQGPHSFGWVTWSGGDYVDYYKEEGRCDTKIAARAIREGVADDARWILGHTRWATHGSPSNLLNNHPITHRNVVGIHNGVLRNHEEILAITGRENDHTEVDSEAIFAAVNKWGAKKGLAKIKGDMVTAYVRLDKPHVIHLARTNGRQVVLGFTKRGNLIWASEHQALSKLEDKGVEFDHFSTLSENRLLVIRDGKIIGRHRFAPITPPKTRQAPPIIRRTTEEDVLTFMQRTRAERRGKILFPDGHPAKRNKPNQNKSNRMDRYVRDGDRVGNLYYWNGHLITESEFDDLMGGH